MDQADISTPSVENAGAGARLDIPSRVCLVSLSNELFAIDLHNVREVFEVESITPIPGTPAALAGVANLRGTVIPLVDLRRLLGLTTSGSSPRFAVVTRHGGQQVGVLVDRVPEIRTVQTDEFLPAPTSTATGPKPFVTAVLRIENRIGGVVEVPTLLAYVETGERHN